jgi:hypothetical protein
LVRLPVVVGPLFEVVEATPHERQALADAGYEMPGMGLIGKGRGFGDGPRRSGLLLLHALVFSGTRWYSLAVGQCSLALSA